MSLWGKEIVTMTESAHNTVFTRLNTLAVSLCVTGMILLSAGSTEAAGLGFFISNDFGDAEVTEDNADPILYDFEYEFDADGFGFGMVYDSNVSQDTLFNYRLNVGYGGGEYDINAVHDTTNGFDWDMSGVSSDVDFDLFAIDNTFGFGIVRKDFMRLWIGPQVRIGYMNVSGKVIPDVSNPTVANAEIDTNLIGLGFAPVIGGNFHLDDRFSLCVALGYRMSWYWSVDGEKKITNNGVPVASSDADFEVYENGLFANLSLIFRFGDTF